MKRVLYGEEQDELIRERAESLPCSDCGVVKGEPHLRYCCIERCPTCHGQALSCECGSYDRLVMSGLH